MPAKKQKNVRSGVSRMVFGSIVLSFAVGIITTYSGSYCYFSELCWTPEASFTAWLFQALANAALIFLILGAFSFAWNTSWSQLSTHPKRFMTTTGVALFLGLCVVNIMKFPYFTQIQHGIFPYIFAINLLAATLVGFAALRHAKNKLGQKQQQLVFVFLMHAFFANLITLPTGIISFHEILPFIIFVGVLDALLLTVVVFEKPKTVK